MTDDEKISLREIEARLEGLKELITSLRAYIDAQSRAGEQALMAFRVQVEERFIAGEKTIHAALASLEKGVIVAEANAEKWRMNANEWRGAMDDREEKFVSKAEYVNSLGQLKEVKEAITRMEGRRAGRGDLWGYLIGALGAALAIAAYVTNALK